MSAPELDFTFTEEGLRPLRSLEDSAFYVHREAVSFNQTATGGVSRLLDGYRQTVAAGIMSAEDAALHHNASDPENAVDASFFYKFR